MTFQLGRAGSPSLPHSNPETGNFPLGDLGEIAPPKPFSLVGRALRSPPHSNPETGNFPLGDLGEIALPKPQFSRLVGPDILGGP